MQYTKAERRALEVTLRAGDPLECPACGARVSAQPVPAPPDVSYVRHRVWIICSSCKRSAAVDDYKPTRKSDPNNRPNNSTQ